LAKQKDAAPDSLKIRIGKNGPALLNHLPSKRIGEL